MDQLWGLPFFSGLLLGLGMILPIGPQNVFILSQSITGGTRRGLVAASTAGFCDSTMIIIGAAGLSRLMLSLPWLEHGLLWAGSLFLFYLGISAFREAARPTSGTPSLTEDPSTSDSASYLRLISKGIGVSWGNPHAILDTVAVLGAAIAAYPPASRMAFAAGTVTASWLFFFLLVLAGALLRRKIGAGYQVWINRLSGIIMFLFALLLGLEALDYKYF